MRRIEAIMRNEHANRERVAADDAVSARLKQVPHVKLDMDTQEEVKEEE